MIKEEFSHGKQKESKLGGGLVERSTHESYINYESPIRKRKIKEKNYTYPSSIPEFGCLSSRKTGQMEGGFNYDPKVILEKGLQDIHAIEAEPKISKLGPKTNFAFLRDLPGYSPVVVTDVTVRLPYEKVFRNGIAGNPGATAVVRGDLVGSLRPWGSFDVLTYSGRELTETEYRDLVAAGFQLRPSRVEVEREEYTNTNALRRALLREHIIGK